MKQIEIKINFDDEKLIALNQYIGKKDENATVQTELTDALEKLYEKNVPAPVRDFIELKNNMESKTDKKTSKPPQNKSKDTGSTANAPSMIVTDSNTSQNHNYEQVHKQ